MPRDGGPLPHVETDWEPNSYLRVVPKLFVLTFIVSLGLGVFEVGLALRGKQELGLTPYQIGWMFSECSLVMFVVRRSYSRLGFGRTRPDG